MSQFLGPIHYIVYEKTLALEAFNLTLKEFLLENFPEIDFLEEFSNLETAIEGNLPEVIDQANIHAWLDQQIQRTEKRYAFLIKTFLSSPKLYQPLEEFHYKNGQEAQDKIATSKDLSQAFFTLRSLLVDGMPCDAGLIINKQEEDWVSFTFSPKVHEDLAKHFDIFLELRYQWLQGFFQDSPFEITKNTDHFILSTKKG